MTLPPPPHPIKAVPTPMQQVIMTNVTDTPNTSAYIIHMKHHQSSGEGRVVEGHVSTPSSLTQP